MTDDTNITEDDRGDTLFFDGSCRLCRRWAGRLCKPLASVGVALRPFENGVDEAEMKLHLSRGKLLGGATAASYVARKFPITWLFGIMISIPPFSLLADRVYRAIAKRRHCHGKESCALEVDKPKFKVTEVGWLVLGLLVGIAVAAGVFFELAGWIWMWLIAVAMWLSFKHMSYWKAGGLWAVNPLYIAWPGMDTDGFAWDRKPADKFGGLVESASFVVAGVALLFVLGRTDHVVAKGWLGVAAMICLLHFGLFVWLRYVWNRLGFGPQDIMRRPWMSFGLGDFWGNRWNRGFSDWARDFLFRPLNKKVGIVAGTMAGFFASGIAHELVISVPARAGYGMPTIYFLLQGGGLLLEKKAKLRRKKWGRVWLWAVVLLPAPLLFHEPFIKHVFNPMTNQIIALWNH